MVITYTLTQKEIIQACLEYLENRVTLQSAKYDTVFQMAGIPDAKDRIELQRDVFLTFTEQIETYRG